MRTEAEITNMSDAEIKASIRNLLGFGFSIYDEEIQMMIKEQAKRKGGTE